MSLKDEIKEYRDRFGFIYPSKNPDENTNGAGNVLLYSSLYYILLVRHGSATPEDLKEFESLVARCEVMPGLLCRHPLKQGEQEGPDDYLAVCVASRYLNSQIANRILKYGKSQKHWFFSYFWNNLNPGKFTFQSWFGRQPQLIGAIQSCAGAKVSPLSQLISNLQELVPVSANDSTHYILRWLLKESFDFNSTFDDNMKLALEWHLKPTHPIARYWR